MKKIKLGDACEILNGFAFKSENYVGSGIRVIRISNVQKGYIEDNTPAFYPLETKGLEKYMLEEGDLLISLTGNVGRVAILEKEFMPAALNQRVACLRLKTDKLSKRYLFHILNSDFFEKQCIQYSKGVAQKNMSTAWLKDYEILLYSKEQQELIADILDKMHLIKKSRYYQLQKLDELVKARFVEMFGNPVIGTEKWPIHTVDNVAEAVDPQPSHRTPPIDPDGIPYVSIKDCDLKSGTIDFKGARKVSKNVLEEHLKRYELHDGDFIIGKIGTLGNPIFVPQRRNYALSANVVLVQPNKSVVRPYFLKYSFESEFVERQFNEAKNSTSQAAFGIQKVRLIRVMNPSLNVQDEFEKFAIEIDKSRLLSNHSLFLIKSIIF